VTKPRAQLATETVTPLPERLATGGGTALFVDGRCTPSPGEEIAALEVLLGDDAVPALGWGLAPPRMHGSDYWWAILPICATEAERTIALTLRATLADGAVAEAALGRVTLVPQIERAEASPARPESGAGPLVAICMATFDPDPAMFETQIESIRAQTHRNWICLISDDGSAPGSREAIARTVEGDPRFEISWAEANAGFYANFERALAMVPPAATHVALSDQDDRWRPDKLERLLSGLEPGARLVFSDMRITTRSGRVVAGTYWGFRPVNYTDFGSEVIANTVTGAACLFGASLLDDVLPFPPRHGAAFHDHWIGQVAMALGPVSYVDEPLYDYVQHDEAALGYLQANGAGRFSAPLRERVATWYGRWSGRGYRLGWRVPYFKLYCRVRVATTTMRLRLAGRLAPDRLEVLDAIDDSPAGVGWLARRALRDLRGPTATIGRERVMLAGLAWKHGAFARRRARAARRRLRG
jgi:glycosyltransferase involved in cell wall biosynthesis